MEEDDDSPTDAVDVVPSYLVESPSIEPVADERIPVGTDVGGYLIDGELGRGGMGVVYAATHPLIGKRAAIKILKQSLSKNPTTVERFIQEARSVNQIGHPNIVDIFAFDTLPDGRSYLVMDLLEGESLRATVRRGPLHVREAVLVIDETASALIAAHDKGFVHRDLKPDNVFLVSHPGRSDVKLLDFGLAKLMPSAGTRAFRTLTGTQLGTPDYMSPEQLRGENVDHRTDVYALGVMSIEILTGKRPSRFSDGSFDADRTPFEMIAAIAQVPEELAQLVDSMVSKEPKGRPSLAAVRAVIRRVRPSLPQISVVGLPIPTGPRSPASAGSLHLGPPPVDAEFPSLTASKVGAKPVLPTPPTGSAQVTEQPSAGLRTSGTHAPTTLGVPPPPARPSMQRVNQAAPHRESRVWLILGIVLCIAAGITLAVVIAS